MKSMSSAFRVISTPVFIAGMTEDEFPSYYAKRDNKLEEEKRLFYVVITRAKRHLVLTSQLNNDWNRAKPASNFLNRLLFQGF